MAEADIFDPKDRVELVDGEVVEMSPIGTRHGSCVDRLNRLLVLGVGQRGIVRVQGPIQVGDFSQPEPDLAVMRFRPDYYADHHPMPPDVLLVIEVADTSLRHDLIRKTPMYVAGGVPEVWVVDLVGGVLHVTRGGESHQLRAGETVSPEAFPDIVVEIAALVG